MAFDTNSNDPRGPEREIKTVSRDPGDGHVTLILSCGHVREPNPIYTYRTGEAYRCFVCAHPLAALALSGRKRNS